MEINIKLLKIQNQWWDSGDLKYDPVLQSLLGKFEYRPSIIDELKLSSGEVSVIQGPRGVGKTTIIKLLIKELIEKRRVDPKNIFYYACHNLNSGEQLNEIIKTFISWRRSNERTNKKLYIFIDEVTLLKDWEQGLVYLESAGLLDGASVLLSGSVYSDIKIKNHSLKWKNLKVQSLSFRDLLAMLDSNLLAKLDRNKKNFDKYKNRLEYYLDVYFLTGGYVSAVNGFMKNATVKQGIYNSYLYWLISDVAKMGRDLVLFRQVIEQVINFQGQSFGFQTLAKKTKAKTHNTVAEYVKILQSMFVLQTIYQLDDKKTINKQAAKKMCFRDPFIFWVFYAYLHGSLDYWQFSRSYIQDKRIFECLLSNVVFSHLLKNENFSNWEQSLAFEKNNQDKDINFVDISSGANKPIIIRYNQKITNFDMNIFKQADYKTGTIISRDILETKNKIKTVPLTYFLLYH